MTRDEAWKFLNLEEGSGPEVVEATFARRSAELSQRVADAATPSLRAVYEQQAARLRQARELVTQDGRPGTAPSPHSLTQWGDLPARTPMATSAVHANGSIGGPSPSGGNHRPDDAPLSSIGSALGIATGQVLADRYEIRALLGSGGMGAVFAALDRVREEDVALKVLLPHLLADPQARERFLNEARVASSLSHPGIVRVFDVHQTAGLTFLTMELLAGRSLREEILQRTESAQRFAVEEVRSIAGSLCDALGYAHKLTVHRDVKPENVWLGEDGTVKLMDFGIARLLRPSQFTSTGLALGTAYYMAPEQLRGQEIDHRADQFALGVILYELLTGEIPQGVIQAPHQVRRSVPVVFSEAVMKALAGDPQKRHADMAALGRDLVARPRGKIGRHLAVSAVVALLLASTISYPFWRPVADRLYAYEASESKDRAALKLRPGDETAAELARRAEIGGRIAKVREFERSGDRDEALTALAELRRQKPDDPDVRKLMDEYIEKIVADGRTLLQTNRFDDALAQFQLIRKLRPGDKESMDQLAGEVESQRKAAERLAAEREEAKQEAIRFQIAEEQEAQERAAAERRRLEAERRRLEAERRRLEAEKEAAWRATQAARRPIKQTNTFGAVGVPAQGGGIFVLVSYAGTPAANLGLENGDVIYTINGQAVNTEAEYFAAVRSSPDDMTFTFRDCRTGIVKQETVRLDR